MVTAGVLYCQGVAAENESSLQYCRVRAGLLIGIQSGVYERGVIPWCVCGDILNTKNKPQAAIILLLRHTVRVQSSPWQQCIFHAHRLHSHWGSHRTTTTTTTTSVSASENKYFTSHRMPCRKRQESNKKKHPSPLSVFINPPVLVLAINLPDGGYTVLPPQPHRAHRHTPSATLRIAPPPAASTPTSHNQTIPDQAPGVDGLVVTYHRVSSPSQSSGGSCVET
ncbi:hypothetical protein V496_01563 [Pseudogymnoascus sp. VKM F-4515 (FW-2607)]|nr:hypothetical protein V496_01563 [Pseudogymnoascus sp. VKM F-4515 (FW-2607)]